MRKKVFFVDSKETHELVFRALGAKRCLCPLCSHTRKKRNESTLCWDHTKNVGYCQHCGAVCVLHKEQPVQTQTQQSAPEPVIDPQAQHARLVSRYSLNKRSLSPHAIEWLDARGIDAEVARQMGCFSIPMGRDDEAIAFVFKRDGLETNIKFRTLKEKGYFFATSGALMHPYNADAIGKYSTLIITEGEMDSIACLCAELPNTIGVPNGAGSKNMAWIDTYAAEMIKVERFYIAADDDARGYELRQALIDKLGAERCHIVTYNGYKDANELLQNGGKEALKAQLQKASQPEIEHIINLSNELDNFEKFFADGGMKGLKIDMPEIDEIVSWRPGSFIVVTGIPGHGKSEFIDFLVVSLNRLHGFKTLFFSPENDPVTYHMSKLSMKITGKRFGTPYMTHEEMSTVYTDIKQNFFFIEPDLFDIDQILELAAVMVKMHGIKVFVVDPFNTLELKNPENISETNVINRLLGKFKDFVRNYNVSMILSAHPRKMDVLGKSDVANHREPTLYDISGSANFYNRCDYGIIVHRADKDVKDSKGDRNYTNITFEKIRWRELGQPASCKLRYNYVNGRYDSIHKTAAEWDYTWWESYEQTTDETCQQTTDEVNEHVA